MSLHIKIQSLRLQRNLSQEALAEILCVSRQAVAKWENNQAIPGIEHLISLSDLFQISVDGLVRETEDDCHVSEVPSAITIKDNEIIEFLLRGKRATYAAHGSEVAPSRLNSHDLAYEENKLFYYDTYLGGEKFSGEEAIWNEDQPVWAMNYCGRLLGEGFSGDFLKEVLYNVPREKPFRGPEIYTKGDFTYVCESNGSFDWFQGYESIFLRSQKIYECFFHGGSVK